MGKPTRKSGRSKAGASSGGDTGKVSTAAERRAQAPDVTQGNITSESTDTSSAADHEVSVLSESSHNATTAVKDNDLVGGLERFSFSEPPDDTAVIPKDKGSAADIESSSVSEPPGNSTTASKNSGSTPYLEGSLLLEQAPNSTFQDETIRTAWEEVRSEEDFEKFVEMVRFGIKTKRKIDAIRRHFDELPVFERPLNLTRLPENIQSIIFGKILIRKSDDVNQAVDICPLYHHGYLPDNTVYNHKELAVMKKHGRPARWDKASSENVDLALLGVNKFTRTLCSKIFYSNNAFVFNDARSCFWFLRRIGRENFRNISTAVFNISSGFFLSLKNRSGCDVCEEQQWCQVFASLRLGHGIQKCVIRFFGFNDLQPRKDLSDDDDKIYMTQGRFDLVAILCRFRGMKDVYIENQRCEFLGHTERELMARTMVQSEEKLPVMSHKMETSEFEDRRKEEMLEWKKLEERRNKRMLKWEKFLGRRNKKMLEQ